MGRKLPATRHPSGASNEFPITAILDSLALELQLLLASACAAARTGFDLLVRYGIRPPSDLVAPEFLPIDSLRREMDRNDPPSPLGVDRGPGGAGATAEPRR